MKKNIKKLSVIGVALKILVSSFSPSLAKPLDDDMPIARSIKEVQMEMHINE